MLQPDMIGPTLTMNTPTTINLAAGQVERVTFNANVGDTVALVLSNVSTTSPSGQPVYVSIYRPDTGAVTTTNSWTYFGTTSSSILNLPNLPASGTYTMTVYTSYGTPASAQLALVPGVTGSVLSNGTTQTFAANATGENVYFSFNADLGDNLELTLNNVNATGSGRFRVNIYAPNGTNIANYICQNWDPGSSCRQPLFNLVAGTYSVVVTPDWGGVITFTAMLQLDMIGPALSMNTPVTINLGAGQVERVTFNANIGDTVALNLSNVSTTSPSGQPVYVSVYRPDAGALTTSNSWTYFGTTGSSTLNLSNLPVSGTYTMMVYTSYGTPGSAQLTLVPGATGSVLSNGMAQTFAANVAGENVYFSFNTNLGDNLELTLNNINVVGGSNNQFRISIYDPSGNNIANYVCHNYDPGSSCRQPLFNLVAGMYSVVVSPDWGGTINFTAQLESDVIGPTLTSNSPANISLASGQVERLYFNANLGSTVTLNLSGVSTTAPTGQSINVSVYRPDVGAITTSNNYANFGASTSNALALQNLPVSGTYTLIVYTSNGTPGNAQLTLVPK
jgi:hypothetical protein